MSMAAQVTEILAGLRRTAREDRRAALFLCAYHSKRAMLLDEPQRSSTLADLAVFAARASPEDIAAAHRYADLRATLRDLGERLATLPASTVHASRFDDVVSARSWADLVHRARLAAIAVGVLLFVAGVALSGTAGFVAFAAGMLLIAAERPLTWIGWAMEQNAHAKIERANEATARAQLRVDSERSYRELVDGPDGAWLRALAASHPALAIPELEGAAIRAARAR